MKARLQHKRKRINKKKKHNNALIYTILLCGLVVGISYLIVATNILEPRIDDLTASYISFNNSNSTDMLKISDLLKMNDYAGKSSFNNSKAVFTIDGKKDKEYKVVLYPTGNDINDKYINVFITINKDIKILDKLNNMETSEDGGIIIYKGKLLKYNNFKVQMWIDNKYKKNIDNISYEIKIKSR